MGHIHENTQKRKGIKFALFLVTIGIVYGDIGTSPLYVMKSIVAGNGGIAQVDERFIIGALSLVIWTVTLLTTVKFIDTKSRVRSSSFLICSGI